MLAIQDKVGKDKWDQMTEEERDAKYKTYRGDCWNHMRNIIIQAMATVSEIAIRNRDPSPIRNRYHVRP